MALGIFLLPLLCWPGLERPFSAPKTWLLALLDLAIAAHWALRERKAPRHRESAGWPWMLWMAALALSSLTAPSVSLDALLLAVLPVPLYWAARSAPARPERWLAALRAGSVAESCIVLLQWLGHDPLTWLGWRPEMFAEPRMRVYGTLGNPDFVAAWLCATLPLYAGAPKSKRKRALWGCAVALQLGAILATGSRVFLLTLPAAALVLVFRRARLAWWSLAGLPVACALLWFSPARPLSVTLEGRLYAPRVVASYWREIPPAGFGPGSFEGQFASWQAKWLDHPGRDADAKRFAGAFDHAHNEYVETLVEYGPAGLCAFAALFGCLAFPAWRARTGASVWRAGAWGGIASLLAIASVDFPFHRPAELALFWILMGMLGGGAAEPHASASAANRRMET